jgi:hypothetical protein
MFDHAHTQPTNFEKLLISIVVSLQLTTNQNKLNASERAGLIDRRRSQCVAAIAMRGCVEGGIAQRVRSHLADFAAN